MNLKLLIIFLLTTVIAGCGDSEPEGFQGYIEGENIYMASPYSGILENLAVRRGEKVSKGQLLFQLDPDPQALLIKEYKADIYQAMHVLKDLENPHRAPEIAAIKAQIAQADARLELAQIRVARNRTLYNKKAIDKDSLDAAIASFNEQQKLKEQYQENLKLALLGSREEQIEAQKAQIASLEAKLAAEEWQVAQKRVYAPANGIIFDTYYRKSEFVGNQQAVLSLLTPDNVQVEFFVPVEELPNLSVGKKITFLCQGCLKSSNATISYISPEAQYIPPLVYGVENSDKLVFRIKAHLYEFDQYKPGQPVMVFRPKS